MLFKQFKNTAARQRKSYPHSLEKIVWLHWEEGTNFSDSKRIVTNPLNSIIMAKASSKAAGKTATKKAAAKKATTKSSGATATKKAAPKKAARKPNAAFMAPLTPDAMLAEVVGSKPLPRTEIVKKVWDYIKKTGMQDKTNKRMINADAKLKPLFGKGQISMFELAKIVNDHIQK
jgi:upstream activation factor subunit UAF30